MSVPKLQAPCGKDLTLTSPSPSPYPHPHPHAHPHPHPNPNPSQATALIYMSNDIFVEGWGFRTSQTALVWRAWVRVRATISYPNPRAVTPTVTTDRNH